MTSEQVDRIDEKLDRIAEGLENLAGKKKKDDFDNAADEDSEIVNNDKEFVIEKLEDGKFKITRNSIALTMEIRETDAGKLNFQFPEPSQLVRLGQWIGIEGFQAQEVGQNMFMWFIANKTKIASAPIEEWILKPDFGLQQKPKSKMLKNPKTKKPLSARESSAGRRRRARPCHKRMRSNLPAESSPAMNSANEQRRQRHKKPNQPTSQLEEKQNVLKKRPPKDKKVRQTMSQKKLYKLIHQTSPAGHALCRSQILIAL